MIFPLISITAVPKIEKVDGSFYIINQDYYDQVRRDRDLLELYKRKIREEQALSENLKEQKAYLDKMQKKNNATRISNNIMITVSVTAISVAVIEGIILAVK